MYDFLHNITQDNIYEFFLFLFVIKDRQFHKIICHIAL